MQAGAKSTLLVLLSTVVRVEGPIPHVGLEGHWTCVSQSFPTFKIVSIIFDVL